MASGQQSIFVKKFKSLCSVKSVEDYRPDFLKNPKTGKNLEIDFYIPILKIGFEYQGGVHFKEIDRYKNNPDDSRQSDVVKSDKTLDLNKETPAIVEVFETDLKGDFRLNLMNRICNAQEFYFNKRKINAVHKLEILYLYLKMFPSDNRFYLGNWFIIERATNKPTEKVCLNGLIYLLRLSDSIQNIDKSKSVDRSLLRKAMRNLIFCVHSCECNSKNIFKYEAISKIVEEYDMFNLPKPFVYGKKRFKNKEAELKYLTKKTLYKVRDSKNGDLLL